jgi:hypothetical protein
LPYSFNHLPGKYVLCQQEKRLPNDDSGANTMAAKETKNEKKQKRFVRPEDGT